MQWLPFLFSYYICIILQEMNLFLSLQFFMHLGTPVLITNTAPHAVIVEHAILRLKTLYPTAAVDPFI